MAVAGRRQAVNGKRSVNSLCRLLSPKSAAGDTPAFFLRCRTKVGTYTDDRVREAVREAATQTTSAAEVLAACEPREEVDLSAQSTAY